MSYIGKGLKSVSTVNITVDSMIGDGSTNTLELSQGNIETVMDVSVYYQGIAQVPNVDYTLNGSTLTFTSIPTAGLKIIAVIKTDSDKDNVNDKSVVGTSFADNAITSSKIIGLDASKLTGALPAMDGSALTNLNIPSSPLENSVSNPTITSNKTLGTIWANTATGNVFVLVDATVNNNVWINAGTGTGNVVYEPPFFTQGTIAGFVSGGHNNATGLNINKFSFASEASVTDWGDLTVPRNATHGSSSGTHGYTGGGYASTANATHTPNRCDTVDKFAFSSSAGATQVGNLAWANFNMSGHEDTVGDAGFFTGGSYSSISGGSNSASIFKFLHASDGTMINWSSLITANNEHTGTSSSTHGYCAGGNPADSSTYISNFLFASANTNTSVGNLSVNRQEMGGSNSATHGYTTGGRTIGGNVRQSTIDKYSFSSAGNATLVGDLLFPKYASCGFSGQQHGYDASGQRTTTGATTVIEKYNYDSDSNSTAVGDLTAAMVHIPAGTQY